MLVDSEGLVLWHTAAVTQSHCVFLAKRGGDARVLSPSQTVLKAWKTELLKAGYTFERVAVIPRGCAVCGNVKGVSITGPEMFTRYDPNATMWEPLAERREKETEDQDAQERKAIAATMEAERRWKKDRPR